MIVYLDLDRTTFRTDDVDLIWDYLGARYPELRNETDEEREKYYHYVDDMYYYDMTAHLMARGLDPELIYRELAESEFADGRLEQDGLAELLASLGSHGFEVRILTFGADDYQRLKASLCPSLRGVPLVITRRPKAEILEELAEECWLVDDKPLGYELPNNVSFVQVNLADVPAPPDVDWTVKRSLKAVQGFFEAIATDER